MRLRVLLAVFVATAVASVSMVAQQSGSYKVPKTPWGEPDLQGIYNGNDLQGIPFQRAQTVGTRTVLNDDEFKQRVAQRDQNLANDNSDEFTLERAEEFEKRFGTVGGAVSPPPHWLERAKNVSRVASFLIDPPDGRMPAMTAEAQKAQTARQAAQAERRRQLNGIEADWTTDRSNYDRCISLGLQGSLTPKIYNSGNRIVQGPGWLAFSNEMIHETRVIPTDGRKNVGAGIKSWMGNSVGRWDGDTLVVETRNLNEQSLIQNAVLSDVGVITERFTLADANTLDYRMTVNDPKNWTAPWTMRMPIPREDNYGFYEYGCHEGNYAMINLLSGSRAEEKRRAEAATRGEAVPVTEPAGGRGGRGAAVPQSQPPSGGGGFGGGVYNVGNGVAAPVPIYQPKPKYTPDAMRAKVQGQVVVSAVVRPDGTVTDVRIIRSLDPNFGLDEEATKTAAQWRFRPGTLKGEPVTVRIIIELEFNLRLRDDGGAPSVAPQQ